MARTPFRVTDMKVLGTLAPQVGDTSQPSSPLNVVATAINAGRVDLSWTASTDDFGVAGYQIFRNGVPLLVVTSTTHSDTTCQPSTAYSYVIVAFDGAGNNSPASTAANATTPANAAPVWQSIPAQTLIVGNAYLLQLTSFCTDADLDTLTFTIVSGTLPSGVVLSGTRLQGTPTTAGQSSSVSVRAADAFHQISTTIAFTTYVADATAPPVPTGLAVAVASTSQLNISWSASVDVAGVANELVTGTKDYRLYRDGVLRTTITAPTLTYSDTGLAAGTTYGYKVTARDQNNNESSQSATVSGTTQSVGLFDPAYPRFGSYALGGTQNASNSALAACHVNIISYYPGWEASRGSLQSKVLAVKAQSSIGSMVIPYTILVDALDAWGTPPQAMWEWYNQLTTNQWFVYTNGLTHTGKVVGSATGWSKPNYTTSCPLVAGDNAARWKAKWDLRLLYTGGTFSNGSNNLTVTACNAIDGKFDDNVFARERSNGDYTVDGVSEAVSGAANISLIQASHGVNADYWRTLAPSGSMLLANSADWPIWYPAGVTGLAFDQKYDGGLMENLEEWIDGTRGSTMATLLNAIQVQMNGYRGSKLGVMDVTVSSATNYSSLRFWHCVSALTGAYLYTHLTSGLLAEELGTITYDERTFSLGAAIDPVQYTPRYQAGANGTGVYRRDFANGIVLVAAQGGTYSAVDLGGTFRRLTGTLSPAVNTGASVTSVTLAAGEGLVLSRLGAHLILSTDFTALPVTGGEGGKGGYLTVYVLGASNFADWGVTSFVTIGGFNVSGYHCVEAVRAPHMAAVGVKRITVRVGSAAIQALTAGTAYPVGVTINGLPPRNPNPSGFYLTETGKQISFTPQPGNILYVDPTNSTGVASNSNPGTFALPLLDLQTTTGAGGAFIIASGQNTTDGTPPGTHVVAFGGTSSRNGRLSRGIDLFRVTGRAPTGASQRGPITLTSYPGPVGANTPQLFHYASTSGSGGFVNGNDTTRAAETTTAFGGGTGWCQYMEFSNLKVSINAGSGSDAGPFNTQNHGQFWRITNCEMTWPSTVTGGSHGRSAGIEGSPVDSYFALNYIHDIYGDSSKENHGIYMDGFGGSGECAAIRNEYAYNYIADITHGTGMQFYGGVSNSDMYGNDVYGNVVLRTGKYGLNWNTRTRNGRAWNNVFAFCDEHGIVYDTTSITSGNTVFNANCTFYGWGEAVLNRYAVFKNSNFAGTARHENCIFSQSAAHPSNSYNWYADNTGGGGTVQFVKNRYFDVNGVLTTKLSTDSTGSYGNPGMTNPEAADFTLAAGSACIDTGNVPTGITRSFGLALNAAPAGAAHDIGAHER